MNKLRTALCISLLTTYLGGCSQEGEQPKAAANSANTPTVVETGQTQQRDDSTSDVTTADIDKKPAVFDLASISQTYQHVNFQVADISERTYDGGNALAVTFSIPLNPAEKFSHYLEVRNKQGTVNGDWVLSESGKVAYFENVQPSTKYTIKIDWHLNSAMGNNLAADIKEEITTRSVTPSVTFASTGHFLPLDLHTGLPVTTLNIPEVDINFHRIKSSNVTYALQHLGEQQLHGHYTLKYVADYGTLIHSGRYQLPAEANKRRTFNIPLGNVSALNEPGLYVATMEQPGTYKSETQATYFMVTDLGIHVRRYKQQLEVFVNSLKTATAVQGASVELLNQQGNRLIKHTSSEEGRVSFRSQLGEARYLIASFQDSYSIVPLQQAALDLSDFDLGKRPYQAQELFIYSERDLYRPGDTVNFSALLRNFDGKKVRSKPLKANIKQANGQSVKNISWRSNSQGYYEYTYKLADNAQVGNWSLEVAGVDSKKVTYEFKVEEFLPERLKLTFNPNKTTSQVFDTKQTVKIPVLGEYLYGAPAAGNRFDARIKVGLLRHPFEEYKDFYFGSEKETQWNQNFEKEHLKTDVEGKLTLDIPSTWKETKSPLAVSVFGSLYETGGRPISRRHIAKVLPSKGLIGIRPGFKDYAPANAKALFEIIKTDKTGKKLSAENLDVVLVREDRQYFWEYSSYEGWHYSHTEKEFVELSTALKITADATGKIELPVDYGHYRLEIKDTDTGYTSTFKFNAGQDWYAWWRGAQNSGQAARPDKVTLALDKAFYKAGDTAKLTLVPPVAGESIIIIEADRPLWSQRIHIPKQGLTIDIPVQSNWNRHDIYISVVHIQPANNDEKITPTRSFGLLHLPLDREDKKLQVSIDTPEKWLPNQKVKVAIDIQNNNSDKTWLTLAAVDVGILNITDYATPEPHRFFFEPRRYQVDSLDIYNRLIELNNNKSAKLRFGGDTGDISRGGKQAKSEVQIVSLFSGLVEVKDGKAMVDLELPDFNGRLRLMAIAFSEDSVGSGEQEIIVAAPLVTQLSMPRFVAMGDNSTLALDLNNLSGAEAELEVTLSTTGPVKLESQVQKIKLADKTMTTLRYPFSVGHNDQQSKISLQVTGIENYAIQREWKLNTRSPYPAITQSIQKVLKPGESLNLAKQDVENYFPESLQGALNVSNVIDLNLRNQMDYLLRYPYGCLEQSTSSTYPWIYASDDILAKMDLKNTTGKTQAQNIQHGLDRITKKHKRNGGFGLWSRDDKYEQHWLTAYVGDFLTDARQQGFQVDNTLYDNTMKRLKEYLRSSSSYSVRWSQHPEHYRFAYRAYAGYVLSRHSKASLGHLRKLSDQQSDSRSFLPLIHLGLALHNQGDSKSANKVLDKALNMPKREKSYLGDYGSEIRDMAQAIHLLTRHKQRADDVLSLSVKLAAQLKKRTYLSTQERNSLFLAGIALELGKQKSWQADLTFAQAKQAIQSAGSQSRLIQGQDLSQGLMLTNTSQDVLYSTLNYSGYGSLPPEETDTRGLRIERKYYTQEGKSLDPSKLQVGDMIMVSLRIISETRMPDLLVVDLLPAGLELENQNLKHAAKLGEIKIDGNTITHWVDRTNIVHQEYRDDRYVAAINIGWEKEVYAFYLARAVTPGEYKVPAPYAEDMYAPETYAVGKTLKTITVSQ